MCICMCVFLKRKKLVSYIFFEKPYICQNDFLQHAALKQYFLIHYFVVHTDYFENLCILSGVPFNRSSFLNTLLCAHLGVPTCGIAGKYCKTKRTSPSQCVILCLSTANLNFNFPLDCYRYKNNREYFPVSNHVVPPFSLSIYHHFPQKENIYPSEVVKANPINF